MVGVMKASGIILAGGQGSRMGRDKTLMLYQGETMVERTVRELRQAVDEIVIVVKDKLKYHIPGVVEIPDIYPGMGPLGGIHAGLSQINNRVGFVIGCDLPFFTSRLASFLLGRSPGYDVVVPKVNNYWEPVCAVYSQGCIGPIEKCLQSGIRRVCAFYPDVRVLEVDQKEISLIGQTETLFYNVNTSDEYKLLLQQTSE